MIRDNVIESVLPISEEAAFTDNLALRPVSGSPLESVCRASNPLLYKEGEVDLNPFMIAEASKNKRPDGVSSHDETMEEAVQHVSKIVSANLALARGTVNPVVKRVVDNAQQKISQHTMALSQPYTVVQDRFHAVWDNPVLENFVSRYEDSPALRINSLGGMPDLSVDQIEDAAMTGVDRFDSELTELINAHSANWLESVYQMAFKQYTSDENNTSFFEIIGVDNVEDLLRRSRHHGTRDVLIVVFCLARKFFSDAPEGASVTLQQLRDWMSTLMNQTGRIICQVMERRNRENRKNRLVVSYPGGNIDIHKNNGANILVNADVYPRWIKEGGTPEALMGAAVTDKEMSYTLLLDTEKYEKAWRRHERIISTEIRSKRQTVSHKALFDAVAYEINTMEDNGLLSDAEAGDSLRQEKHKALTTCMGNVTGNALSDERFYYTSRKLVCDVLFPRTEANAILSAIDTAASENEDIDIREAGYLATIEIVSDWVADQIEKYR